MGVKSATARGLSSGLEPGLVLLNSTDFTAVANQVISPVFSSTYSNYRVTLNITANSASGETRIRLRSGATNAAGSNYYRAGYYNYASAGASGSWHQNGVTSIHLGNQNSAAAGRNIYVFDFASPFLGQETTVTGSAGIQDTAGFIWVSYSYLHDLANSYDGLDISVDTGTISGRVRVYGYNQ